MAGSDCLETAALLGSKKRELQLRRGREIRTHAQRGRTQQKRVQEKKRAQKAKGSCFEILAQCLELGRHSNIFKALLYLLSAEYLLHP